MIKNIAHVAFSITDIQKSLDFYVNKLGFKKKFTLDNPDGTPWIIYLEVTKNQFLELFPTNDKILNQNKNSYQHLCLEVDNIHELEKELENNGIQIDEPIILGLDNNYQFWIHDPDNNPIEIMEYGLDALQLK